MATAGELYAGLEHFTNDGSDATQYDITGDMEDIFQVRQEINNNNQNYSILTLLCVQELASNLQYPELAEFSLNQMCKGRFTGHWSQSPGKWAGQEQLLAAAAAQQHSQALLNVGDSPADGQHPRQANLVLLDYPMQSQQRLLDPEELQQLQVSPLNTSIS